MNGGTTADATGPVHTSGDVTLDSIQWRFQTDEPIKYYPRPYNAAPAAGLPPKDPPAGKFFDSYCGDYKYMYSSSSSTDSFF